MFSFSKKIDMVFIDKNDGNTIKTLGDAVKPSETIKPINDYINESNPIASLGKDLHDKGLTFENFSDQDLGHVVLFWCVLFKPYTLNITSIFSGAKL